MVAQKNVFVNKIYEFYFLGNFMRITHEARAMIAPYRNGAAEPTCVHRSPATRLAKKANMPTVAASSIFFRSLLPIPIVSNSGEMNWNPCAFMIPSVRNQSNLMTK